MELTILNLYIRTVVQFLLILYCSIQTIIKKHYFYSRVKTVVIRLQKHGGNN